MILIFLLSGLVPLISFLINPGNVTLLVYTIFVLVYFLSNGLKKITLSSKTTSVFFVFLLIVSGFITESLSWLTNYLNCEIKPNLFHPQLLVDLTLSFGFYGSWTIAWLVIFKKYYFSLKQIFLVQGVFGVLIEQNGSVFFTVINNFPSGILSWLYIFLIYGSTISLPLLFFSVPSSKNNAATKYVVTLGVLLFFNFFGFYLWSLLLNSLNFLPSIGTICDRPLW